MKIISGEFKGRVIKGFDIEGTRPTMDRVKESLFSMIQFYIRDSIVLDLFSGTGNLGIESLSNGASFCYFNDINNKCINYISKTLKELKVEDKSKVFNMDYKRVLSYFKNNNIKLDIIFLDPPYKFEWLNDIIKEIYENNLLNKDGLIICEVEKPYLNDNYYFKFKEKKYGNKYIIIYKNKID